MLLMKHSVYILKVFFISPNPWNNICFLSQFIDIGLCMQFTLIWFQESKDKHIHNSQMISSPFNSLHLNLDNDKRLEKDANPQKVSIGFPVISRSSSFQISMNKNSVSHHHASENKLRAGLNSGVRAWGRGRLRKAGLSLISSSFIPSPHIITLSGRGYPPPLWSIYQLQSASRPRLTGWLSWGWWGDDTAAWVKPNQTFSRITDPPAICGTGPLNVTHLTFLPLY